jgi:hypothetical protein
VLGDGEEAPGDVEGTSGEGERRERENAGRKRAPGDGVRGRGRGCGWVREVVEILYLGFGVGC